MIGQAVSHYKILEKLGEGGMGVLHKAEDTKLKRTVALKFLSPELTRDEAAKQRFIHEAQAASALQDNNICTIHDIDETEDGQLFIVMDCYEGESLKEKIARGPMKLEEAVNVSVQIAEGLSKAHEKGIVHRDIKPGNIIITNDGVAKILDFGLAKLAGQSRMTKTGSTVGTAAYMSPEQARGMEVDHRTDIWSVGIVLYEMLTGKLPFRGEHEAALLYSIVHEEPQGVSNLRSDVPQGVVTVIRKALQKDRGQRYQTVKELLTDLKSAMAPGVELPKQEKSIVVLPFEDLSPDRDQEYFSDGLTEEIISDLSNVRSLRVTSRSSAMTFKGTKKKIPEIARDVNVQYVLEGSVRKAGNSLRITAELIDATTDAHVWAEKFSGTLDDVFDIQEKVSRSIVDALKLRLTREDNLKLSERPIENVQAYECYLSAKRDIQRGTEEGLQRALRNLQLALEMIGENALINKGMAEVYLHYYEYGVKADEQTLLNAEQFANKVIRLQPESADSYYLLGRIERFRGSASKAIRYFKQSFDIHPDNPDVLLFLGNAYGIHAGKTSAGEKMFNRLFEIDPLSPLNYGVFGIFQMVAGQLDDALSTFQKFSRFEPDDALVKLCRAYVFAWQKRLNEVFELVDQMVQQRSVSPIHKNIADWGLFFKYALQGEKAKALETMSEAVRSYFWNDPEFRWFGVCNYALIDEKEEALNWVEHMIDRGWLNYPFLNEQAPFLENIRGEERFKKLMERVKKEWEEFEV